MLRWTAGTARTARRPRPRTPQQSGQNSESAAHAADYCAQKSRNNMPVCPAGGARRRRSPRLAPGAEHMLAPARRRASIQYLPAPRPSPDSGPCGPGGNPCPNLATRAARPAGPGRRRDARFPPPRGSALDRCSLPREATRACRSASCQAHHPAVPCRPAQEGQFWTQGFSIFGVEALVYRLYR